jgi:hypothetical protein
VVNSPQGGAKIQKQGERGRKRGYENSRRKKESEKRTNITSIPHGIVRPLGLKAKHFFPVGRGKYSCGDFPTVDGVVLRNGRSKGIQSIESNGKQQLTR